jgi:serine protease Do
MDDVKRRRLKFKHASSATATSSTRRDRLRRRHALRAHPHGHPRHHLQHQPLFRGRPRASTATRPGRSTPGCRPTRRSTPATPAGPLGDRGRPRRRHHLARYLGANNLGFAIPSNTAKRIVAGLVRDGEITRSYIGIVPKALQDLEGFYALALEHGHADRQRRPGLARGPRRPAGGDILLAINGKPVDGRFPEQLPPIQNMIASQPVGSALVLTSSAAAGGPPRRWSPSASRAAWARSGPPTLGPERAQDLPHLRPGEPAPDDTGVLVIGVQPGFPADVAGLQPRRHRHQDQPPARSSLDVIKAVDAGPTGEAGADPASRSSATGACRFFFLKP